MKTAKLLFMARLEAIYKMLNKLPHIPGSTMNDRIIIYEENRDYSIFNVYRKFEECALNMCFQTNY